MQTLINIGFVLLNLLVLGLNLKLYTEILKDKSMSARAKASASTDSGWNDVVN